MMRNLVTSLFEHERITTTVAKAKEARPVAERLITRARRGDLSARRLISAYVRSEDVARKLMEDIAPRFATRPGGYTRIYRLGPRPGDAGQMGILELVERKIVKPAKKDGASEKVIVTARVPRPISMSSPSAASAAASISIRVPRTRVS